MFIFTRLRPSLQQNCQIMINMYVYNYWEQSKPTKDVNGDFLSLSLSLSIYIYKLYILDVRSGLIRL